MTTRDRSFRTAVSVSTAVALVVAVAVIVFSGDGDGSGATDDSDEEISALDLTPRGPADDAMGVELVTFDGATTSLGELVEGDTPVVVNFFASWCTPCVREMPAFEEVHQELGADVSFLGLAVRDQPEDAQRTIDSTGITYDVARDVQGDLIHAVGAAIMPSTVFVDAAGDIVEVHAGELERDELIALIEDLFGIVPT